MMWFSLQDIILPKYMSKAISEDDPFYFISQMGTLQTAYNKISPVVWVWL